MTINDLKGFDPSLTVQYLNTYQMYATSTAVYPGVGTMFGLSYVLHKMAGETGEANEHFGKAQRDDSLIPYVHNELGDPLEVRWPPLTPERRKALIKELGDVLWYVSAAATELGVTLEEVANENLLKLYDRKQRGVLQGSGDNR